jgi:hypothetical protein
MPESEPSRSKNGEGGDAYSVEDDITAILEIGKALDTVMEALGIDPLDYTRGGASVADVVRAQTHAILEAIARLRSSGGARG